MAAQTESDKTVVGILLEIAWGWMVVSVQCGLWGEEALGVRPDWSVGDRRVLIPPCVGLIVVPKGIVVVEPVIKDLPNIGFCEKCGFRSRGT